MKHAAIYVRVSTAKQAERDLSIPDQIAQCRKWCDDRDYQVVEVFSEPGASALDEDRPVFQEMIFKAKRADKPFDVVVVHSLSRFSRDTLHSEFYVRELRKAKVELISITQDVGTDSSGEFMRKLLNVFDEHQSRETAKHVHRSMLENTRQGFWNGSKPPFGYSLKVAERRGNKDKKVLVVNEGEAPVVRQVFDLASGGLGRPMGVKAIAVHLNERDVTRRGTKFSTGSVHQILNDATYHGTYYFNQRDSRKQVARPPSEWVAMMVPAIIAKDQFDAVAALLHSRNPKRMPPRNAHGPTLLAGIARCGHCGSALIQNTGKGGTYRYYCCSRRLKEGSTSCKGLRMSMPALDEIVISEVAKRVLERGHLRGLLEGYVKSSVSRSEQAKDKISQLRHSHKEAEAAMSRLLALVEAGTMQADDPNLRERLVGLRVQRDELTKTIAEAQKRLSEGEPEITDGKIETLGLLLRDKLFNGSPEFRRAYAGLLVDEVRVTKEEISITGSKSILARLAASQANPDTPEVLSFVRKWRTRRDSNP